MKDTVTVRRCACGCGQIVRSTRANAIYANGSTCRTRALRARRKERDRLKVLPVEWAVKWARLGETYGERAWGLQGILLDLAKRLETRDAVLVLDVVLEAMRIEYDACLADYVVTHTPAEAQK